jgi:hypothetical protein
VKGVAPLLKRSENVFPGGENGGGEFGEVVGEGNADAQGLVGGRGEAAAGCWGETGWVLGVVDGEDRLNGQH